MQAKRVSVRELEIPFLRYLRTLTVSLLPLLQLLFTVSPSAFSALACLPLLHLLFPSLFPRYRTMRSFFLSLLLPTFARAIFVARIMRVSDSVDSFQIDFLRGREG